MRSNTNVIRYAIDTHRNIAGKQISIRVRISIRDVVHCC